MNQGGGATPLLLFQPCIANGTQTFSAEFSAPEVVHMHMINKVCDADGDSKE